MTRTRGPGEGSIYKRKDGRWVGALVVGYDASGRSRRRVVYGKTRREVVLKLDEIRGNLRDGTLVDPSRLTLGEFLTDWLARLEIRPTTLVLYDGLARNHILPRLGGVRVQKLEPIHIQTMLDDMKRLGVSARVRANARGVLHTAMGAARKLRLIKENPVSDVDRPRVPRREMRALVPSEMARLLSAASGHRMEPLIILAAATGMRQGEIFGLQWGDIDLHAGRLTVQRTIQYVRTVADGMDREKLHVLPPKTRESARTIPVPQTAIAALAQLRDARDKTDSTDWVFADRKGNPVRRSNFARRVWSPIVEAADLAPLRFHELRHTAVSWLMSQRQSVVSIQSYAGHASAQTTTTIYSHVLPGAQDAAAEALDILLGGGRVQEPAVASTLH